MKVTQEIETTDHVVIGNTGTAQIMELSNEDGALYEILSSSLYKNPLRTMLQEVICNAWDAHIEAGITDTPIKVVVDAAYVSITDMGSGIPHKDMNRIYATYGSSTKKENAAVTGGFGLGCKAPFAYSNSFTVTNNHVGTKGVYLLSRDPSEHEGKPTITEVLTAPTSETGITVSIPRKANDGVVIKQYVRELCDLGGILLELDGEVFKPSFPADNRVYIVPSYVPNPQYLVRYGNVIYNVSDFLDRQTLFSMEGSLRRSIIIQLAPNTVSVLPSREGLRKDPKTLAKVLEVFKQFSAQALQWRQRISADTEYALEVLRTKVRLTNLVWNELALSHLSNYFYSAYDSTHTGNAELDYLWAHMETHNRKYGRTVVKAYIQQCRDNGSLSEDKWDRYEKAKHYPREVGQSIKDALGTVQADIHYPRVTRTSFDELPNLLALTDVQIYLCRPSQYSNIRTRLKQYEDADVNHLVDYGFAVCVSGRTSISDLKTRLEEATGLSVYDASRPTPDELERRANAQPKKKKASNAPRSTDPIPLSWIRNKILSEVQFSDGSLPRISKPMCVVSAKHDIACSHASSVKSVADCWGDRIGVVSPTRDIAAYTQKTGIPHLFDYLEKRFQHFLKTSPNFKEHITDGLKSMLAYIERHTNRISSAISVFRMLINSKAYHSLLPPVPEISEEEKMVLLAVETFRSELPIAYAYLCEHTGKVSKIKTRKALQPWLTNPLFNNNILIFRYLPTDADQQAPVVKLLTHLLKHYTEETK